MDAMPPTRGNVISALSRMAEGAREHGHYSFDRLDAGWVEMAIDLLIADHEKKAARQ